MKNIMAMAVLVLAVNTVRAAAPVPGQPALEQLGQAAPALTAPGPLPAASGPVKPLKAGRDLTADYQRIYKASDRLMGRNEKAELRKYKVLLVAGFLSNNATAPASFLGLEIRKATYFQTQIKILKALGVDYALTPIESEQTPEYNAGIVGHEIAISEKPVIIFCHSKGGLDTLAALIEYRGLRSKVRGVVTIQTPYFGSPVADYVLGHRALTQISSLVLEANSGTIAALRSLETGVRQKYYDSNKAAIEEIESEIPMLSFASWEETPRYPAAAEPFREAISKALGGFKNDGYVPLASAVLPGTDYILAKELGHLETVIGNSLPAFTNTLLLMITAGGR